MNFIENSYDKKLNDIKQEKSILQNFREEKSD